MRMHLFAAAAASVLAISAAAPAFAQIGYVDASIGSMDDDVTGNEVTYTTLSGAYSAPLSGGLNFQVEGAISDQDIPDLTGPTPAIGTRDGSNVYALGGSLFARNESWAYGASVLYINFGDAVATYPTPAPTSGPLYTIDTVDGYEGSLFLQNYGENFTATVRGHYGNFDVLGSDISYRGVDLDGVFFLTDNASVNVGVTFTDFEGSDGGFGGIIGFEWKTMNMPFGLNAAIIQNTDSTSYQVGIRATFGGTLKERSQSGTVSALADRRLQLVATDTQF